MQTEEGQVIMMEFGEFKKTLGEAADKYTEQEIDRMRIVFFQLGNILFNDFLEEKVLKEEVEIIPEMR